MGGDGKIGGGGSCWVNFLIKDGISTKRLHAFDRDAKEKECVVTVKFPKGCRDKGNYTYEVDLVEGTCVEIRWPPDIKPTP